MPKFTCHFTATMMGAKISRRFRVTAKDQYAAIDAIRKQIGGEYDHMTYPTFKFGPTKGYEMSRAGRFAVANQGAEE